MHKSGRSFQRPLWVIEAIFYFDRTFLKNKKPLQKFDLQRFDSSLTDQGSNLDSSEPKSDVLPVTPSVNLGGQN